MKAVFTLHTDNLQAYSGRRWRYQTTLSIAVETGGVDDHDERQSCGQADEGPGGAGDSEFLGDGAGGVCAHTGDITAESDHCARNRQEAFWRGRPTPPAVYFSY